MRIGTHEFEVTTAPYQDGWRSVAFLPGGKQRASATQGSKEAAEMDLYKQLKGEFDAPPRFDPKRRYEAKVKHIVSTLLEAEEPAPEHYINKLPAVFKPGETIEAIQNECAYCMDDPEDKAAFIEWIKQHENLFPDVAKALAVIERNDSWCTDELADMSAFFEALGYSFDNTPCPRCDGSGEEPGSPVDDEGGRWLCQWCGGEGKLVANCECDNTHQQNNTVCQWCWARGRRHFNDPPV